MRWSGLAALLEGLLCLLLMPIQASIFSGADASPFVLASEPLLDLAGTVHGAFGPRLGLDEYYFYGRMFFLVYLGAIAGLAGLHALQSGVVRREKLWFRVVLVGLVGALLGDVVAYWGGSGDISESPAQGLGFTFEMLAVLAVLIGSVLYGGATLGGDAFPRWAERTARGRSDRAPGRRRQRPRRRPRPTDGGTIVIHPSAQKCDSPKSVCMVFVGGSP